SNSRSASCARACTARGTPAGSALRCSRCCTRRGRTAPRRSTSPRPRKPAAESPTAPGPAAHELLRVPLVAVHVPIDLPEDRGLADLDAVGPVAVGVQEVGEDAPDRKSTRLNSSHVKISYAVFCLKKKNNSVSIVMA